MAKEKGKNHLIKINQGYQLANIFRSKSGAYYGKNISIYTLNSIQNLKTRSHCSFTSFLSFSKFLWLS